MYNKNEMPLKTAFCQLFLLFLLGQSSFDRSLPSVKKQSFMKLNEAVHVLSFGEALRITDLVVQWAVM